MNTQAHPWWSEAVVYQVYPRSFADDNGDGLGDLRGLIRRLPYLEDLGVDAVWLTPFYPSPLADGGYDVSDYRDVDPRIGTLAQFDELLQVAKSHNIRVIVDLVPNHCSSEHPLFQAALAAGPGSPERELFIFRSGRGADGQEPPNNWPSNFGGAAWTRVPDGQWYLHLFDSTQPDFNWAHPEVRALFENVIRFWLDRGVAGLRIDVAHGMFKEPGLPDLPVPERSNRPNAYTHRPEVHELYRDWRAILDSYPAGPYPGARTAVGEVWADSPPTLAPYLAPDGLPQVFNFELITSPWKAADIRAAIDATQALAGGSRAPWVLGNHDVIRPVTRLGSPDAARAAALLLLALPGSAYIYQGEELGLPEVLDIPDAARQDPRFLRTKGEVPGRDGCRVPLPWSTAGDSYGFSRTNEGSSPAPPWLPQPEGWGAYSAQAQASAPGSFLNLYRTALRLRRSLPALGAGSGTLRWLEAREDALVFARDPGFVFAANLGTEPLPLPAKTEVLLTSAPLAADGALPPDGAAWLTG
ncbi:MAG: glycoside hydrolase family 13 protein [Nocardiopsaceae bacterium]|nr:glycoside hydrolase family 13 protein [Nocardiopsaceae bacterium]